MDANVLVYAHVAGLPQHEVAHEWLDKWLNGTVRIGFPWPSVLAFVRLVPNPRVFQYPEPVSKAWAQVEQWLDREPVWIPQPTDRHREIMRSLLAQIGERSNLAPDAHLAALAIEHGLKLCSTDGDFARFSSLHWENPLLTS